MPNSLLNVIEDLLEADMTKKDVVKNPQEKEIKSEISEEDDEVEVDEEIKANAANAKNLSDSKKKNGSTVKPTSGNESPTAEPDVSSGPDAAMKDEGGDKHGNGDSTSAETQGVVGGPDSGPVLDGGADKDVGHDPKKKGKYASDASGDVQADKPIKEGQDMTVQKNTNDQHLPDGEKETLGLNAKADGPAAIDSKEKIGEKSLDKKLDKDGDGDHDMEDHATEDDDDLSEDFKEKAQIIFETAVNEKVNNAREELREEYASLLSEALGEANTQIDAYVDVAVKEWLSENALEVKYSLRTEIAENFIRGMKTLFQENYIDIPDDEVSVVDELTEAVESLKEQLEEQEQLVESSQKEILVMRKDSVVEDLSQGLTVTQSLKLEKMSENVESQNVEEFRYKMEKLKEAHFVDVADDTFSLNEEILTEQQNVSDESDVSFYANFLGKTVR